MTGEPTTLHERGLPSAGTLRHFGSFVRRPELPDRVTGVRAGVLPVLARLFVLDVALMGLLILAALAAAAAGFKMPGHLLDSLGFSAPLLLFILVGAPIGEELLFRSWLSGRPGHVGAFLIFLCSIVLSGGAGAAGHPLVAIGAGLIGIALAIWVLWAKRGRPPMAFFAQHFRWFYWGSALAFASVHLTNFPEGNSIFLLPLTLPQFLLGLILGYVRVNFGIWANMLFHAVHNTLFIGLVLLGTS